MCRRCHSMPLTEQGDNKPESELVGSCPAISRDMWRLPPANYNDGSESREVQVQVRDVRSWGGLRLSNFWKFSLRAPDIFNQRHTKLARILSGISDLCWRVGGCWLARMSGKIAHLSNRQTSDFRKQLKKNSQSGHASEEGASAQ